MGRGNIDISSHYEENLAYWYWVLGEKEVCMDLDQNNKIIIQNNKILILSTNLPHPDHVITDKVRDEQNGQPEIMR